MYDYYLGGVRSFPADRQTADAVAAHLPQVPAVARANRAFVVRAVRYLAGQRGVRQFLDIGCGLPTSLNVHDIVQAIDPSAAVAYVDRDTTVVAELLDQLHSNPHTVALRGDLHCPQVILAHRQLRKLIDFGKPIGLVLGAVLHYLPDTSQACQAVQQLVDALPAGSFLAFTHPAAETFRPDSPEWARVSALYRQDTGATPTPRCRAEVSRFLDGLKPLDPGVVDAPQRHADPTQQTGDTVGGTGGAACWVGIGAKLDTSAAPSVSTDA